MQIYNPSFNITARAKVHYSRGKHNKPPLGGSQCREDVGVQSSTANQGLVLQVEMVGNLKIHFTQLIK